MAIKRETMCRCEKCGEVMALDERKRVPNGGGDVGEDWYVCPYCDGDSLAEVAQCDVCGQYFEPDEISFGMCPDCIIDESHDVANVAWYGYRNKEHVAINGLFERTFTESEIDEILWAAFMGMTTEQQQDACEDYIANDPYMFAKWLTDPVQKQVTEIVKKVVNRDE